MFSLTLYLVTRIKLSIKTSIDDLRYLILFFNPYTRIDFNFNLLDNPSNIHLNLMSRYPGLIRPIIE